MIFTVINGWPILFSREDEKILLFIVKLVALLVRDIINQRIQVFIVGLDHSSSRRANL